MRTINAIVSGTVQGVFFRDNTCKEAKRLGITGWVRNNSDGTVELEATGTKVNIRKLVEWLHIGSEQAEVTGVKVFDVSEKVFDGFTITH